MTGLSVKYAELLSLSLLQRFYQNNYCKRYTTTPEPDFILLPTGECLDTMKRLDFICRQIPENAGLSIFSSVLGQNGGGDNLLRFKPMAGDKLSFWIMLKNPAVFNFDQLPVQQDSTKIFYFSNQVSDGAAARNNLHLTTNANGADEISDRKAKKPAAYQYHHNATVAAGTAVVKHILSGTAVAPKTISNQVAAADLYFDLSALPQGNCQLLINNVATDTFYYMGTGAPQQAFGVIELLLSATVDANYRIVETDRSLTKIRPLFCIPFTNRSTRWRYTVELTTNSPLYIEMNALAAPDKTDFINRLNIITNDTAIAFTQTSASPDGTSFQFVSNTAVALQEKYLSSSSVNKDTLNLTLKKYVGTPLKEAAVRTDLQCPSTGGINAINNPVIYSDILLTI